MLIMSVYIYAHIEQVHTCMCIKYIPIHIYTDVHMYVCTYIQIYKYAYPRAWIYFKPPEHWKRWFPMLLLEHSIASRSYCIASTCSLYLCVPMLLLFLYDHLAPSFCKRSEYSVISNHIAPIPLRYHTSPNPAGFYIVQQAYDLLRHKL